MDSRFAAARQMARHVAHLRDAHDFDRLWALGPWTSEACSAGGWAKFPPVTGQFSYAVALHEIGHVVARRRTVGTTIEQETVAWQWALGEALPRHVGPRFWASIGMSLDSYRQDARLKKPPARHPFWELLRRAEQQCPDPEA